VNPSWLEGLTRQELQEHRAKAQHILHHADEAVKAAKITQAERDALLLSYYGTTDGHEVLGQYEKALRKADSESHIPSRSTFIIGGFLLLMLGLFATLFYTTGGITGAVILENHVGITYLDDATLPLELNGITRFNVSGSFTGDGYSTIALLIDGTQYNITEYNTPVRTDHASLPKYYFTVNDTVSYIASNVSSAYLISDQAVLVDNSSINNLPPGKYQLKLIINDTELVQEVLAFEVVDAMPFVAFNTCGELCTANLSGNATLQIITEGNVTVQIDDISMSNGGNSAPQLSVPFPDMQAQGNISIDLRTAFADPDGDTLYFDSSDHAELTESIKDGILTISGPAGTYTLIVYASDLAEITPSNIFTITISDAVAPDPAANSTSPSLPVSTPVAPVTDCDEPDPNLRPLSCIQGENSTYFKPEDILLENKNAIAVGQLTPVGNLLIKGGLIEQSNGTAAAKDYQMGFVDNEGDFVATVWIDSATGDLHLRGHLTEANGNIPIAEGYSAIANKRGIVLALIDRETGDMIVRGNIVPYRRTLG
jgi:hypothetical protein